MSPAFALMPDAKADIQDAYAWYEAQRTGRGDEFVIELYKRIEEVCAAPKLSGLVNRVTRAAMLPISKFIIY